MTDSPFTTEQDLRLHALNLAVSLHRETIRIHRREDGGVDVGQITVTDAARFEAFLRGGQSSADTQARRALDVELGDNDSGTPTVRTYLIALLEGVWRDGESFNGKRPFGNSSWQHDLYKPLIAAGLIPGDLDEDGDVEDIDYGVADDLIKRAIAELGRTS